MESTAFVSVLPSSNVGLSSKRTFSFSCRKSPVTARKAYRNTRSIIMSDEEMSPAERTRQALAESESLVKFRKETTGPTAEESEFRYTNGTTKGGFDIWLVTALLTFVVPAVGFAIGVATGNIDISPR